MPNIIPSSHVDVRIVQGDIAGIPSDALIAPINSSGMWAGAIDGVICRHARQQFHDQARARMPLRDGQTINARKQSSHSGAFDNVVFVIDDLRQRLSEVVRTGLVAADLAGYSSVTLPAMRLGVMLGVVERSIEEAIQEMAIGTKVFVESNPQSVKSITFVVYNDPRVLAGMANLLTKQ